MLNVGFTVGPNIGASLFQIPLRWIYSEADITGYANLQPLYTALFSHNILLF
jgi:hypothetical protein